MGKIRSTLGESTRTVYTVPPHVEDALTNWARWAAPRHGLKRRENVLAKMCKSTDRWAGVSADLGAPPQHAVPPDADTAWRAEKVLCHPGFPAAARSLIQQHWLHRQNPVYTCRLLALPVQSYEYEVWSAATMFWNRYSAAMPRAVA